ncbi:RNA polymerase sigma-70 factor [Virgisporangium aurantiacum]|uniref:RNA polymerase sigma-70 factor n=1 Tax=Virgisporangium aurantiacum TaxID=175570 RepID=UPI00194F2ED1|nr:RNA polymerase sigma-70 factor [Virgisporangium aurantiacum]
MTADLYGELRPRAFAIAYRMLGSVSEAEDVVQEAFLRMHQLQEPIVSPRAYVATLVTRLAIDHLRSARVRRERYVGEWLPEPVVTDLSPAEQAEQADSLSLAFLVLLESLTPRQRAAFLLREVFDYPYQEVADIVGTDVDGARHLVSRARASVRERRPRHRASREQRDELAARFFAAVENGDLRELEALLANDVALHGDGGGTVPAPPRPITGRERVARTLRAGRSVLARFGGVRLTAVEVNGGPGAMVFDTGDLLVAVVGLDVVDGRIQAIRSIVNPDKLRHLGEVSDLGARLRAGRRS